nr:MULTISPECIES: hypothetical protein [Mycobacterium avium complex (MAC)]
MTAAANIMPRPVVAALFTGIIPARFTGIAQPRETLCCGGVRSSVANPDAGRLCVLVIMPSQSTWPRATGRREALSRRAARWSELSFGPCSTDIQRNAVGLRVARATGEWR